MRPVALALLLVGSLLMLNRMLLVASGGGVFTPPPTPSEQFVISAAPDGAWSWFGDPRAVEHNGHLYVGYVDTSGNIGVVVVDLNTLTQVANVTLKAALDYDDHSNPSFLVRASDHKLMAWYASHDPQDSQARMRISTTSLDTDPDLSDGFAAEVNLDAQIGAGSYNYPNPYQLSNGDIHLFYRDGFAGSGNWIRTISTDDGATWGAHQDIYVDTFSYMKIRQSGDRLDFALTNNSPNIGTTHVYHMYWEGGTFYKTDGTAIGGPLPHDSTDVTLVYNGTVATGWTWDVARDPVSGHPRILIPNFLLSSDHRYHRYDWDGSAWSGTQITTAGPGIDATNVYSGGFCFDPADPDIVYASKTVDGQKEIWRYTFDGSAWSGVAVTVGSPSKNIRPYVVGDTVLWLTGTYTGWNAAFNMGISGYQP